MKKTLIMVFVAMAVVTSAVWAADAELKGDAAAGKAKSVTCAACHGADGNSSNPEWPKLAGQGEQYLFKQLMDYKEGRRDNASMNPMVAPLNPQDMADLAAYYASQSPTLGQADSEQVKLGEQVFKGGNLATGVAACAACHGPNGTGVPEAKFPALAGQHATYTVQQLNDFRRGVRNNDAGRMMRNVAKNMTEAEIDAVAEYVQGLQR